MLLIMVGFSVLSPGAAVGSDGDPPTFYNVYLPAADNASSNVPADPSPDLSISPSATPTTAGTPLIDMHFSPSPTPTFTPWWRRPTPTTAALATSTPLPLATATATSTRIPTMSPTPTATHPPILTPTATNSPIPTPTTGATGGVIPQPLVFVSRAIPPDGSKFDANPTNSYPGVGGYSRFVSAGPGKLQILSTNGQVTTLLDGNRPRPPFNLVDFNAPDVSYDGTTIVFAGLPSGVNAVAPKSYPGAWRIYTIDADGTNLRQVTTSNRSIDLSQFGSLAGNFTGYDDTDPIWLPDGRICFSSTRYPESAEYEGVDSTNLYVVNPDGSNLHRITSEKNGADRPLVDPLTGQIVFSRWWRNNHFAVNSFATILCGTFSDCNAGDSNDPMQESGLTIDFANDSTGIVHGLDTNGWQEDAINPDGTGLHVFSMAGRNSRDDNVGYGGGFLPDGRLITNFFMPSNLNEEAGFGGLRLFLRGFNFYTPITGITTEYGQTLAPGASSDVFQSPTGYAAEAAALSNGKIVIAWAPDTNQDYGLYTINLDGSGRTLLYDNPGTTETRPVVLAPRPLPPIIPDTVTTVAPLVPPTVGGPYVQDGTFVFQDLNVYANAPVDAPIVNAAPVGSLATIRFYADPQQGSAISSIPETSWPTLLATATVTANGAVINPNSPADIPLFEQGRGPDGVTVPVTTDPDPAHDVNGAAHVAGANYGRPGTTVQCVGCHAGHSAIPVGPNPQFTNLATGATVTVSSIGGAAQNGEPPIVGALNDRQVKNEPFTSYWRSAAGQTQNQWVQLSFPVPITVSDVRLYDPLPGSDVYSDQDNIHMLGATVVLYSDAQATQSVATANAGALSSSGTDVTFSNVTAQSVRVYLGPSTGTFDGQAAVSLSEIEVIAMPGS